jgi:hypothetical protein
MENFIAFDERAFHVARVSAGFRSVSRFARCAGLSESYGRQISHGLVPSEAVRHRIAALLNVPPETIWKPSNPVGAGALP